MATQPTKNPVPSESPRDLKFNAGKIDEFTTSLAKQYVDRLGNSHYTIEGINELANQVIVSIGWVPSGTFQAGANITNPNQILKDESSGEYYRWDGKMPKVVSSSSTPDSAGGVGVGAWISVGDAALRSMLASSSNGAGDELIAIKQAGDGALARTQHDKNAEIPSLKDYGAKCDGVTDDLSAFQALRAHYPSGQFLVPGKSKINNRILPAGVANITQADFAIIGTNNKVENPNFSMSASGWTLESGWNSGTNKITHLSAGLSRAYTKIHVKPRTLYQLSVDINTVAAGIINFKVAGRDLFPGEVISQENGNNNPGIWVAAVSNSAGEDNHLFGVSPTTWEFSWLTGNTSEGDYNLEIITAATGLWRGEISRIAFIEVQQELNFSSAAAISSNDSSFLDTNGFKISNGNYNVTGLGDRQTLQFLNGKPDYPQANAPGAHNVAIGARTLANAVIGDENVAVGAMAAQYAEGTCNTWMGYSAGKFAVKAVDCVGLGYKSLTSASIATACVSIGYHSNFFLRTADNVTAIGYKVNHRNLQGSNGTFVGYKAGFNDGGDNTTAIGYQSGAFIGGGAAASYINTTAVGASAVTMGTGNTAIGFNAHVGGYNTTTGAITSFSNGTSIGVNSSSQQQGVAVGANSSSVGNFGIAIGESSVANGSGSVSIGLQAGLLSTGANNTSIGNGAGKYNVTNTFSNTTCLGSNAVCTGDNQIQIGSNGTTPYAYANLQLRSDARDKSDVIDSELGIDFILGLKPKQGYYDFRESYGEWVTSDSVDSNTGENILVTKYIEHDRDGSRKQTQLTHWFIAQEVEELCDSMGVKFGGLRHNIPGDGREDVYTLSYEQFVPPITKAIQSCWDRMNEIEERLKKLEK